MQNPGNSSAASNLSPEVQIIQGIPTVVNVPECQLEVDSSLNRTKRYTVFAWRDEYDTLDDPNVMTLLPGTYDTYKCNDCNITLSGYKRGDPGLNEHVRSGRGQCRYIKIKFKGREQDLLILQGKQRFQMGLLAFPEFMLCAKEGYIKIAGTEYCIVCTCPSGEDHYIACADMTNRLKTYLKRTKLDVPIDKTPLFTRRGPRVLYDSEHDDGLETDSTLAYFTSDFSALGDSANMYHIPHTVDTHKCFMCDLQLKNFVANDTLLGEHIYYICNNGGHCPYIADRFKDQQHELMLILGKERYRKGSIAFPDTVTKAAYGYTTIGGCKRCIVCSAVTIQGLYLPPQGHHPHCDEMKKSIQMNLKTMTFLQ